MQVVISVAVGAILAVLAGLGLVATQSAAPPPVTSPYVTYDS